MFFEIRKSQHHYQIHHILISLAREDLSKLTSLSFWIKFLKKNITTAKMDKWS